MLINAFVGRNQVETRGPIALKCSHDTCIGAEINLNDFINANRNAPRYEKTGFLHMRKQRRRSAAQ